MVFMTSKDLNLMLIELFPEIKVLYAEEVTWQEGDETGSHVVFGDVLLPYILANAESENMQCLTKCFQTIEKILSFDDEYADEVITLSVLESLSYQTNLKIDLSQFMGDKTKRIFAELLNT